MKIEVLIGKNFFDATHQEKTFESEEKAVEWIMRNHEKIYKINNCLTYGQKPNHFELYSMLRS